MKEIIIYLDYAATTPVDPRVAEKMLSFLTHKNKFGNPTSQHHYGQIAKDAIDHAREQIASVLSAHPEEMIWTSGATESINLALKGAAHLYSRKGKHIITLKTEHKAVLDVCQQLEKERYLITYLTPDQNGLLDLEELKAAINKDTILVSILHVNNELGVIQNIQRIAEMTAERQILLHVDAAQSIGKIAINLANTPIDLLSMCAHKVYGPKGIGALYLRKKPRVRVEPLIHGGGHEQGMRSGTLPTHQIVGMGEAFFLAHEYLNEETKRIVQLRERFLGGLKKIKNIKINGDELITVPHILNVRFEGMIADAILAKLPFIAASKASACQGANTHSSHVLRAIGLTEEEANSAIRFSFGRFLSVADIDDAVGYIRELF